MRSDFFFKQPRLIVSFAYVLLGVPACMAIKVSVQYDGGFLLDMLAAF